MKRYLGLDYGDARVGTALATDGALALPLVTIDRRSPTFFPDLKKLLLEHAVTDIVIGWPLSLNGQENERTAATARFIAALSRQVPQPIHRQDERLSTKAVAAKGGAKSVDANAAAEILQTFLDSPGRNSKS